MMKTNGMNGVSEELVASIESDLNILVNIRKIIPKKTKNPPINTR